MTGEDACLPAFGDFSHRLCRLWLRSPRAHGDAGIPVGLGPPWLVAEDVGTERVEADDRMSEDATDEMLDVFEVLRLGLRLRGGINAGLRACLQPCAEQCEMCGRGLLRLVAR